MRAVREPDSGGPGRSGEPHSGRLGRSGEPHSVVVLALPGTIGFDLATAVEVFRRVYLADGSRPYLVRVCGTEPVVSAGPFGIATDLGLEALSEAETIVVPARDNPTAPLPEGVLDALRVAYERGTRIASICAGAFTLAEAGILDGKRATTHWLAAELFREMYPAVHLDADVLYVDEGQVLTSAGAAAGLDLCLHIVARDHGAAVAAEAARVAVPRCTATGGKRSTSCGIAGAPRSALARYWPGSNTTPIANCPCRTSRPRRPPACAASTGGFGPKQARRRCSG
ncbi:HTH-type transcriptional regulator CdhR [Mycobacteroides abscessus]|nr:HTH-type transcriptional regulator CdhR [Mycobacteroides abscessus]